ncbi:hypothetical protein E4H12_03135 [Candidatus Thorarchaeota archaeon]|nr:MAG: hypothetical protein E4H12_03135 [Candidatus Thorarchaeota archaeon]
MTDPEPVEEIVPRILKQYSERPRGWHIMNTPRGEVLVLSSDSAFQLKLIPLNPQEFTGAGVELPESNDIVESIRSSPEFGLRPLSESDLLGIAQSMGADKGAGEEIGEILSRTPLSLEDLSSNQSSLILRGPVLTRPDLGSLSPDILKMQMVVDRSAQKTFRKRYPMRAGMYV